MRLTVPRVCEHCAAPFDAPAYNVARGRGRFCSQPCASRGVARPKRDQSGEKNPSWRGGVSKHPVVYTNRFRAKFPEKVRCHRIVASAIRSGILIRPGCCSACSVECRPQAHHDDYRRPLKVRWLCRTCHRSADQDRMAAERRALSEQSAEQMKGWPLSRLPEIPATVDLALLVEILGPGYSRRSIERQMAAGRFPIPRRRDTGRRVVFAGVDVKRHILRLSQSTSALRLVG